MSPSAAAPHPLLAATALLAAACLDVADNRARLDLAVGRARSEALEVEVEGGLAAVRRLKPRDLALWAQAPAVSFRLRAGNEEGGVWRVTVNNALPDGVLRARTSAGAPLLASEVAPETPTEKRWLVDVPAGSEVLFELAPADASSTAPWRFAVFGDVQDAIGRVQDIYEKMNGDAALRFVMIAGDLTESGTDEELARFEAELTKLRVPCFATQGNHELGAREGLFQKRFGRGSYHFAFRGVRFTMLDSASGTLSPVVYDWLDGWIELAASMPHVVVMHIPPIDPTGIRNGSFGSRAEASLLLSRLAAGGVDITFYGHVHSYRAFTNAAIPAFITGGGGAIPERFDGIGRHYLVVKVDPVEPRFETALVRVYPE